MRKLSDQQPQAIMGPIFTEYQQYQGDFVNYLNRLAKTHQAQFQGEDAKTKLQAFAAKIAELYVQGLDEFGRYAAGHVSLSSVPEELRGIFYHVAAKSAVETVVSLRARWVARSPEITFTDPIISDTTELFSNELLDRQERFTPLRAAHISEFRESALEFFRQTILGRYAGAGTHNLESRIEAIIEETLVQPYEQAIAARYFNGEEVELEQVTRTSGESKTVSDVATPFVVAVRERLQREIGAELDHHYVRKIGSTRDTDRDVAALLYVLSQDETVPQFYTDFYQRCYPYLDARQKEECNTAMLRMGNGTPGFKPVINDCFEIANKGKTKAAGETADALDSSDRVMAMSVLQRTRYQFSSLSLRWKVFTAVIATIGLGVMGCGAIVPPLLAVGGGLVAGAAAMVTAKAKASKIDYVAAGVSAGELAYKAMSRLLEARPVSGIEQPDPIPNLGLKVLHLNFEELVGAQASAQSTPEQRSPARSPKGAAKAAVRDVTSMWGSSADAVAKEPRPASPSWLDRGMAWVGEVTGDIFGGGSSPS